MEGLVSGLKCPWKIRPLLRPDQSRLDRGFFNPGADDERAEHYHGAYDEARAEGLAGDEERGLKDAHEGDEEAKGGEHVDAVVLDEPVPKRESGGGDKGEVDRDEQGDPVEVCKITGPGGQGCQKEQEAAGAERKRGRGAAPGDRGDFFKKSGSHRPGESRGEEGGGSEAGVFHVRPRLINRTGDAGRAAGQEDPVERPWGRCFEDERCEQHPPETTGADQQCGKRARRNTEPIIEKDILEIGLPEHQSDEWTPGCLLQLGQDLAPAKGQHHQPGEQKAGAGKNELLAVARDLQLRVAVLDDGKGAAPERRADQDLKIESGWETKRQWRGFWHCCLNVRRD